MKQLSELVCLMQVAVANGYDISTDAELILSDLKANGTEPARPLECLFALYDLQVVAAHTSGDISREVANRLERFGIEPGELANGYGAVLDRIYDSIATELKAIDDVLAAV